MTLGDFLLLAGGLLAIFLAAYAVLVWAFASALKRQHDEEHW